MTTGPQELLLIAGAGQYPRLVAEGARAAGVKRLAVLALRGQTSRKIEAHADDFCRLGVGEMARWLNWIESTGIKQIMLAGQIHPSALFTTRFDTTARKLISKMRVKSAHTIFGAIAELFEERQLHVLPASTYMDRWIPEAGVLTTRAPDQRELADIEHGHRAAMMIGKVDIGQTVVIKDGMILAVEAFEGTNAAIRRGGRLGGAGGVVVKVAREGHDMRFDIPVIGAATLRMLRRNRISALAFQAKRIIFLDREEVIAGANKHGIAIVSLYSGLPPAPTRPPIEGGAV